MLIGNKKENVINNKLFVDEWEEVVVDNSETGEVDLVDKYIGEVALEEVLEEKYFRFCDCKSRG